MKRPLLLFAVIVSAVVIASAVAAQRFVVPSVESPERASSSLVPATQKTQRRAPESPAPASEGESPLSLSVVESGGLERFVDGNWAPLTEGTLLFESDRIRTKSTGRAIIGASDGTRVELVDEVDISVSVLTRSLTELELRQGRLRADLGSKSNIALRVRSSGAVAEGRNGAFTVFADGSGMVAVASETAAVKLMAQDVEVELTGGQQSIVRPGAAPSDPELIAEEVFLEVDWPAESLRREKRLVLRGRVAAGTEVRIGGRRPEVEEDGSFEVPIELDAGTNRISVNARDPAGRSKIERSPPIVVRNRPPRLEVIDDGIWQQ